MTSTPLVDWPLLGRVVLVAVLGGVGVVVVFSLGLAALSISRDRARTTSWRVSGTVVAVVATAALLYTLWWGLELITNKG